MFHFNINFWTKSKCYLTIHMEHFKTKQIGTGFASIIGFDIETFVLSFDIVDITTNYNYIRNVFTMG
jgi:hypothetical protein